MKTKPMILTILFGMVCALLYVPWMRGANSVFPWLISFRLIIWCYLVCYAIALTQWSRGNLKLLLFPLTILLGMIVLERSHTVFLLLCLGILAWIRSSVCFQRSWLLMLATEAMLGLGGGALVLWLNPRTNFVWALGIWMFFLVQSLYFVMGGEPDTESTEEQEDDLFERACRQAEKLLSSDL